MLIETHAHLDYQDFAPDFDDVLRRATEAGVTRIITIGTSIESSLRAVALAEKHPNVFAVIGVHPRSEEHTSELQSHVNLVCRLLLEKKKKKKKKKKENNETRDGNNNEI